MSELPKGWAEATLADVTSPRGEKADPQSLRDMPFLGMDHIEAHTANLLGSQPVNEMKSAVAVFKKGDLLYGRLRPYLNKVHLAEFDGAASAEFIVFPPSEAIEQRFLQSLLRSPEYRLLADQRSTGDRPRVKFDNVSDFEFSLPPLAEQKRIVRKIDTLSARTTTARTHLNAIAKLVERFKAAVLDALLPSPDAALDSSLLSTFYGPRFSKDAYVQVGGVPTIRTTDFSDDGTTTTYQAPRVEVSEKDLEKWKLQTGDILVTRTGSIGKCALFEDKEAVALPSAYLIRVRVDTSELLPRFAFLYFVSPSGQRHLGVSTQAVAQPNINANAIRSLPISVVPLDKQLEIVCRIETAFAKIDRLATEAEKALRLTDRLDQRILAKAFAGELVPQDPNDEPASALLERIREARANQPKPKRQTRKPRTMKKKSNLASLLNDWPSAGVTFEELRVRAPGTYDHIKEELFEMMTGEEPKIRQEFDSEAKTMRLKKVSS